MEVALKILQFILFVIVSLFFLPMLVIVHYGMDSYEKWFGNIMKF